MRVFWVRGFGSGWHVLWVGAFGPEYARVVYEREAVNGVRPVVCWWWLVTDPRLIATPAGDGYVVVGPLGAAYLAHALGVVEREQRLAGAPPSARWLALRDAVNNAAAFAFETAKPRGAGNVSRSHRVLGSDGVGVERVAKLANCSTQWVRELCRRGEFVSARRLGTTWVLDESDVAAWVVERAARRDAAATGLPLQRKAS